MLLGGLPVAAFAIDFFMTLWSLALLSGLQAQHTTVDEKQHAPRIRQAEG